MAVLQRARIRFADARFQRYTLIGGAALSAGLFISLTHSLFSPVKVDEASLISPVTPSAPAMDVLVAREYGRLGQIFIREGASVAPGQVLFSLKRDPMIQQDLVDRALARDLSDVNAQIRDARREINTLTTRLVMSRPVAQPRYQQQIAVAHQRLSRRLAVWQQGGLSRDFIDQGEEHLLRLQRDAAEWEEDRRRQASLKNLLQQQKRRLAVLVQQQEKLRTADLQRRADDRIHPPLQIDEQSQLDYATYRAPARGTVLRLLKKPGDAVKPRETIAVLQKDLVPPEVEATLPNSDHFLLQPGHAVQVEIPSLRQKYSARYVAMVNHSGSSKRVRLALEGVPASETRRLLMLPGEPVSVLIPRDNVLVRWFRTRELKAWSSP